jgi:hypothetical protein
MGAAWSSRTTICHAFEQLPGAAVDHELFLRLDELLACLAQGGGDGVTDLQRVVLERTSRFSSQLGGDPGPL